MIDFQLLIKNLSGATVDRPNAKQHGTLSGHAAGEPFEKYVYHYLKEIYPNRVFKQFEFLNDIYLRHPEHITLEQRQSLFNSPSLLFLLSRGEKATKEWSPSNIFEEKQNDTADILFCQEEKYQLIDIKTRNIAKEAQAPNIISAYKLAQLCALMIDNNDFENIELNYVEVDWAETEQQLVCQKAYYANLFLADPKRLYINWASGMQIQFHVKELNQTWSGTKEEWSHLYIRTFVNSAKHRCKVMKDTYITPFLKYIKK